MEDSNADLECQRLNTQAREAQRLQQEAQEAREAIAKCSARQRQLKMKEQEFQVAKLVTSLLQKPKREGTGSGAALPRGSPSLPAMGAPPTGVCTDAGHRHVTFHRQLSPPHHVVVPEPPCGTPAVPLVISHPPVQPSVTLPVVNPPPQVMFPFAVSASLPTTVNMPDHTGDSRSPRDSASDWKVARLSAPLTGANWDYTSLSSITVP